MFAYQIGRSGFNTNIACASTAAPKSQLLEGTGRRMSGSEVSLALQSSLPVQEEEGDGDGGRVS